MKVIWFMSAFCFLSSCSFFGDREVYVAEYKGDKKCAVSYTFDDGLKEHYTLVIPKLEENGIKGTFWVIGSCIRENDDSEKDTIYMSWPNLREMVAKGHEVSNHTWSHKNLTQITVEEAWAEIAKNDSIIIDKTGIVPRTFCYPYNARNEEITEMASKNRVDTRTHQFGIGGDKSKSTPENLDQIINELLESGKWGVAMIHGITYQYDFFDSPSILWDHLAKVKSMEDSVWIAPFVNVASYIKEKENIKIKVTEKTKTGFTVVPELALDKDLYTELLTLVVNKKGLKGITVEQDGKSLSAQILPNKVVFDFNPYGGAIRIDMR